MGAAVSPRRSRPAGPADGADADRHAQPQEPTSAVIKVTARPVRTGPDAAECRDRAREVRRDAWRRPTRPMAVLTSPDIFSTALSHACRVPRDQRVPAW